MPHFLGPMESKPFRLTLNPDGQSHTRENILAIATLLLGIVAFATGFVVSAHVIATAFGMVGFAGGLFAQYVSVTTPQRSIIIVGVVASFVGGVLGIAHGGFS